MIGHRFARSGVLARGAILFSLLLFGVVSPARWASPTSRRWRRAPWFGLPRLFAFGGPGLGWELAAGAVFGVLIGYVGSIAESIGDYAGTCAVSGIAYRVRHMHRGITVEGIASAIGPLFGGLPLTTYSQNTGVIATTRVASRRVVQVAAVILLLYGLSPKLGRAAGADPAADRRRGLPGDLRHDRHRGPAAPRLRPEGRGLAADHRRHPDRRPHPAARRRGAARSGTPPLPPLARLFLGNAVVIAITLGHPAQRDLSGGATLTGDK